MWSVLRVLCIRYDFQFDVGRFIQYVTNGNLRPKALTHLTDSTDVLRQLGNICSTSQYWLVGSLFRAIRIQGESVDTGESVDKKVPLSQGTRHFEAHFLES